MHPAKVVERNEMLFGKDTHVVPSYIVLDSGSSPPHGKGKFEGSEPGSFAAMPSVAKLLWPLL